MIRVYPASKLRHAKMWRELDWPQVLFTARWLKHNLIGTSDSAEHAARFWRENEEDVAVCDAVFVYGEPEDKLRGALVEAGMGIAYGKTVIVVGQSDDYGTWQHHPLVKQAPTLGSAYGLLRAMDAAR